MDADKLDVRALLERYDAAVGYADTAAAVKPLHAAAPQLAREHIAQAEMIAEMRASMIQDVAEKLALAELIARMREALSHFDKIARVGREHLQASNKNDALSAFGQIRAKVAALALPDPVGMKP